MKLKSSLLSFLVACIAGFSTAQNASIDTANIPVWIDMMQDGDANFYETQRAFELYWQDRERQPGDGWKVFKRWENYWEVRVNADGSFPQPDHIFNSYSSWRTEEAQNSNGLESTNGDWVEIGPIAKPENGTGQPNGNGRLNGIGFHPTDTNIFWVGAPSGGLWYTNDGGQTWTSNTDNLPTLGVSCIVVDYSNPDIVYIGTGDRDANDAPGLGVMKSVNGGATWNSSNTGMGNRTVGAMLMHPADSTLLIAATSGGMYRSTNAGNNWAQTVSGNFKDVKFKPGDPSVLYACSNGNFYRSSNTGVSWTQITTGMPTGAQRLTCAVSDDDPSVVYVLVSISSAFGGLYKSDDSGLSFTLMSDSPNLLGWAENGSGTGGQGWYDLAIESDPDDASVVYVGGVNIWKSIDSGQTWDCSAHWVGSSTAASVHADQHWLARHPITKRLYVCNDGGLYYTDDEGETWPEISDGLGIAQLYKLGVSALTEKLVINGYQDNGTAIWDDTLFRTERGGDGMECLIDYEDDNVIYASVYYGNIAQSFDNGYSFSAFAAQNTNGITESGAWVTPYILDPSNSNRMFIGYKNVWRSDNVKSGAVTWTSISNSLAGSNGTNMRDLVQAKADPDNLYALRSDNRLFRSTNAYAATPAWWDLTSSLPTGGTTRDIETHATNANVIWLVRGTEVYRSNNKGSSWANISANLPNININCIVTDPLSHEGLYVGTDAGIYYTDSTLSNWISFDDGFPATAEVTELEIYHKSGDWSGSKLRAATYGRGLWESDLYDPENIAPLAFLDVSIDSTDICSSDTITLYNNSAYGATSSSWSLYPSTGWSFVGGTNASSNNPKVVFSESGTYSVGLSVANAYGSDSIYATNIISIGGGIPLHILDNFENDTECSTGNCQLSCPIQNWTNLQNGVEDDIDFRVNEGGTPSNGTGPAQDYNPGTSNGNYIYTEASFCFNQLALLESPCLDLTETSSPEMGLAYHMNGGNMGSLNVDVFSNGAWTSIWNRTGSQGADWNTSSVNLSAYEGTSVKLRFRATTGNQYQSDIALDDIAITASPLADFSVSDSLPCVGETITLSDSSTLNPVAWSWTITPLSFTFQNGTGNNSQNPELLFNQPGTYNVTLQATNIYGSDFEVKTGVITVNAPDITVSYSPDLNTYCQQDSIGVDIIHSGSNLSWSLNGASVFGNPISGFTPTQVGVQTWVFTSTDSSGCTSSDSKTVNILATPSVELICSDDDLIICEGDTVHFTIGGSGAQTQSIIRNGVVATTGALNNWSTSTITNGEEIVVSGTSASGCVGYSDTLIFTVLPLPAAPSIWPIGQDSLRSSLLATNYFWFLNGNALAFNQRTIPIATQGGYSLRITQETCLSELSQMWITGSPEIDSAKEQMSVFPNPFNDELWVVLPNKWTALNALNLTDLNGRILRTWNSGQLEYHGKAIRLDLSDFANGTYFLEGGWSGKSSTVKVVKLK